jgi:hypothetical protein
VRSAFTSTKIFWFHGQIDPPRGVSIPTRINRLK